MSRPIRYIIYAGGILAVVSVLSLASTVVALPVSASILAAPVQIEDAKLGKIDERAYNYYVNGVILEEAEDYLGAAENYRQGLKFQPDSYQIRLSFAQMLFRLQRFEETLGALELIEPKDAEVHLLRAATYRALNKDKETEWEYLSVVKNDPDDLSAYSYLANVYRQRGNIDSTIWAFENIVRIRPDNYRLWQDLAKYQIQIRNLDSAKALFWSAIKNAPSAENALSYVGLGEIYQSEKKPDSAAAIFLQGVSLDPENTLLNRVLTSHYIGVDSLGQALTFARRLSESAPQDRAAARRLGSIYFELDSMAQAETIFLAMANSGVRDWIDHYYLGRIYAIRDDLDKARDEFELVTRLADTLAGSWLDLALIYRRLEKPEKEIEAYQNGLNKIKDEGEALRLMFALGATYEREDKIDEAVETFERIISQFPDNHQALNYLGYTLADRNIRLDYARDLIDRAMKLEPDNAAYVDSYGWVLYRQGNFDEAVTHLTRAASLQNDPVIFDHLGDALARTGADKAAREWWDKALQLDPNNDEIKEKLAP